MEEYSVVEPEQEKGNPGLWTLLIFIPIIIIFFFVVLSFMFYTPLDFFKTGTNPQMVYNQTQTQITIKPKSFMTSDQFIEILKIPQEDSLVPLESETAVRKPKLEYQYDFYNKQNGHLSRCKTKKTYINFSKSIISEFVFNYKEEVFNFEVTLYNDLYDYSDELKNQDCYFDQEEYSRGYLEDPYNNNFMDAIAEDFIALRQYNYTNDQIAEIATVFVQSITYGTDETTANRYPYETLFEKEGNCLDKSIILIGILEKLGYELYLILGLSTQYHALPGIVCKKGNIQHDGKELCFIETTIFTPISSEIEIEIEQILKISDGDLIYQGDSYGQQLVEFIQKKQEEINLTTIQIDSFKPEAKEIEKEMCQTDCAICDGDSINSERTSAEIKTCKDANEYNDLAKDYNNLINNHNELIRQWYDKHYELEKSMFGNVEYIKRT